MSNAELLPPLAQKHIEALFQDLEKRLYTSINTFHIELRQELLAMVSKRIDEAIDESLEDYRLREKPSAFFTATHSATYDVPVSNLDGLVISGYNAFPAPSTPWDDGVTGKTYATFPPARIISPIEDIKGKEEEEEKKSIPDKEEEKEVKLLLAIEELINQKLSVLSSLPSPTPIEETPPPPTLPPELEVPTYSWGNYDPMAYARSAPDIPGGFH